MKCNGKFKFKSLTKKEGGTFTNNLGKEITYSPSYSLKVDEITDKGIFERSFKIPYESDLVEPLLIKKPYSDLNIEFEIGIYGNTIKIVPLAILD